jgi:hypothetical protein
VIHALLIESNPELALKLTAALTGDAGSMAELVGEPEPAVELGPTIVRDPSTLPGWRPGFKPIGPAGGGQFVTAEGGVSRGR